MGVGWHCKVCDCFLKDSMAYLDHINGKKHQRTLGFTMRVEQSSIGDVKARLEAHKRKLEDGNNNNNSETAAKKKAEESAMEKMAKVREEEEEAKRLKKEERKQRKEEKKQKLEEEDGEEEEGADETEMDPEMAAMMGFGSFGGGGKKK